jgi:hypothetical protein
MDQLRRNQINMPEPQKRPDNDNIVAQFLGSLGGIGQGLVSGIGQAGAGVGQAIGQVGAGVGEAIGQAGTGIATGIEQGVGLIGQGVSEMNKTPEGRLALRELVGAALRGVGQEDLGVGVQQYAQRVYTPEAQRALFETKQKIEAEKAERKAAAEAKKAELTRIAGLSKELRQTRNRFTQAGFGPITENDSDIPLDLKATYYNPVTGELENVVNQKEATKRQVNVFQDGKKIKMYAYTADDAKEIKKATESKQKIDAITKELIRLRDKYGSETFPNKAKTDMKKYYRQLQLAFKDLNNLGVISDSDYKNFIEPSVPDPTRWARPGTVVQELKESINFAEDRLQDIYESRVYNYQRPIKPITDDDEKDKKNDLPTDDLGNTLVPGDTTSPTLSTGSLVLGVRPKL